MTAETLMFIGQTMLWGGILGFLIAMAALYFSRRRPR